LLYIGGHRANQEIVTATLVAKRKLCFPELPSP